MKIEKIRLTREEAFKLFPIAGYGVTRFSRGIKANPVGGGWWKTELSPLTKSAPFRAQREKLEL
jgi:hypothetical protein